MPSTQQHLASISSTAKINKIKTLLTQVRYMGVILDFLPTYQSLTKSCKFQITFRLILLFSIMVATFPVQENISFPRTIYCIVSQSTRWLDADYLTDEVAMWGSEAPGCTTYCLYPRITPSRPLSCH
jgi:hypothetical protein